MSLRVDSSPTTTESAVVGVAAGFGTEGGRGLSRDAAAAEARDLSVLHCDADYDRIAAVTGQACEWVVPAGAAD